jgi:hypothetical protein
VKRDDGLRHNTQLRPLRVSIIIRVYVPVALSEEGKFIFFVSVDGIPLGLN